MKTRLSDEYALLLLMLAGLALRLIYLGGPEFWYDEAFTVLLTRLPFDRMMLATAGDTHPPLYYLLMWVWSRIAGESEFAMRLPSVLAGVAAIPLIWLVTDRLQLSHTARWAVVILMAVGPFELYFGQEARMYTLVQLAYLWAVLALLDRKYVQLGAAILAMLYLHNYGLFYVTGLGLLALYQERRLTPHIAGAFALPALIYAPWMSVLIYQMSQVSGGYWIEPVTVGQVVYTLTLFLFGPFTRQWVIAATMVAIGATAYAAFKTPRRSYVLYWLAIAPMALAVLASLMWKPVYLFRGLIGCAPFFYMLILQPLADLPGWRRVYAGALIVPLLLIGLVGYWSDVRAFKSSTLEAVARIGAEFQDGDILVSSNDGNWVMFTLYQDRPVYLMPPCEDGDRGALSDVTRQALGVQIKYPTEVPHQRVWLLWNWGAPTSACNRDRVAQLVGDAKPWWLVKETEIQTSGIWLLNP
jgi:uncharacterized membrane protein